jgi:hypothetical protein
MLLPAAALVALALPASASALIQVDRGIAGARVGNTVGQVHAALGRPARSVRGRSEFGRFLQETYAGGVQVTYQGLTRVTAVDTTGLGDRTARGVGVGSTEATVRAKVAGLRCETVSGFRSCHTGTFSAGERVTDFSIRRGTVTRVSVGIVID